MERTFVKRYLPVLIGLIIFLGFAQAAFATIINISATTYGTNSTQTYSPPYIGELVYPFSLSGGLDQLTLGAGTYTITNGSGEVGAAPSFTAWRYNGGNNWTWSYVIADDSNDKIVAYGTPVGTYSSQSAVASLLAVQNYSGTLTLTKPTTLDFLIWDYYLPDNAAGIALNIQPASAVPEPSTFLLLGISLAAMAVWSVRRKRAWTV